MGKHPGKLDEWVDLLSAMERGDRIDLLIDVADRFREVPAHIAQRPFSEEHKVPACESEAYLWARPRDDGGLQLYFAVENPQGISAKAMAVILDEGLSGVPLQEVASVGEDLVYDVFGKELSMGKSMGLMGMVSMAASAARRRLAGSPDQP